MAFHTYGYGADQNDQMLCKYDNVVVVKGLPTSARSRYPVGQVVGAPRKQTGSTAENFVADITIWLHDEKRYVNVKSKDVQFLSRDRTCRRHKLEGNKKK